MSIIEHPPVAFGTMEMPPVIGEIPQPFFGIIPIGAALSCGLINDPGAFGGMHMPGVGDINIPGAFGDVHTVPAIGETHTGSPKSCGDMSIGGVLGDISSGGAVGEMNTPGAVAFGDSNNPPVIGDSSNPPVVSFGEVSIPPVVGDVNTGPPCKGDTGMPGYAGTIEVGP